MPFPYTPSAASARNRRLKERESRTIRTSSSNKRPRDISRVSDNRSPAPNPRAPHSELYAQENAALEQLPPLPSSGTASPSSSASPVLQSSQLLSSSAGVYHLATTPHTPASLRKYLESEPELENHDFPLTAPEHNETSLPVGDQTGSRQSPAPLPTSEIRARPPSPASREPFEAVTDCVAPPPPAAHAHTVVQPFPTSPKLYSPTPVAPKGPFLANSHPFTPATSWQGSYSNEYQYPPTYIGQQYYGMVQPNGAIGEGQPYAVHQLPYLTDRDSPHPIPMPYDPLRTSSSQATCVFSRQGIAAYTLPITQQTNAGIGDQVMSDRNLVDDQRSEDDTVDLLYRVQNAIPDLHLLLNRYKQTSGQLGQRENLIRQTEAQKAEALRQKEVCIERLEKELEFESQKHSTEMSTLRLELRSLEVKYGELQDTIATEIQLEDKPEMTNESLQKQNCILEQQTQQALDAASKDLKQVLEESNQKELSIREELLSKTRAEDELQVKIVEMSKWHMDEREHLKTSWARERRDLETSHAREILELEKALEACRHDLEKSRRKEKDRRERWDEDRKGLIQTRDAELVRVDTISEQRYKALEAQHTWEKVDTQTKLTLSLKESLKRIEENNAELKSEVEKLKAGWDADKHKFDRLSTELKNIAEREIRENNKLQKRLESFGDVTEFRTQGDHFYVDAFNQIRKQILELATQYCKGSLGSLPELLLNDIPAEIPDFTSDTRASIQLRAAYVQHIVSRVLHKRIFQPFLFTLTRRHADVDKLFQTVSESLRYNSWRREASWRQQTLNAAYTVSGAKQSINRIAAVVLEEIIEYIQHLTCVEEREQVKVAVRRIIKLSAETWRYARLERELIIPAMPLKRNILKVNPDVSDRLVSQFSNLNNAEAHVILPLLPAIRREAKQKELGSDAHTEDRGCTYLEGEALCPRSSMLVARLLEVENSKQILSEPVTDRQKFSQQPKTMIGQLLAPVSTGTALESVSSRLQENRNQSDGVQASEPYLNTPSRSHSARETRETRARDESMENIGGKDTSEAKEVRGTRRRASVSRASLHTTTDRRRSSMILPTTDGSVPDWITGSRRSGSGKW